VEDNHFRESISGGGANEGRDDHRARERAYGEHLERLLIMRHCRRSRGKPDPLSARGAFFQWAGTCRIRSTKIDPTGVARREARHIPTGRCGATERVGPRGEGVRSAARCATTAPYGCRLPVSTPARPREGGDLVGRAGGVHRAVAESTGRRRRASEGVLEPVLVVALGVSSRACAPRLSVR